MNVYLELLNELGLTVENFDEECHVEKKEDNDEDAESVHDQYSDYEWGNDAFGYALKGPTDSVINYALNHEDEVKHTKKIHRYIRKLRFKPIFLQIIGLSSKKISRKIILLVVKKLGEVTPENAWRAVRDVLKENKIKKHYNDIPTILRLVLNMRISNTQGLNVIRALEYFDKLSEAFDWHRDKMERSYFLNMRFVAIKLAKKFDIEFPYYTPLTRTPKKEKYLEELFSKLEGLVNTE